MNGLRLLINIVLAAVCAWGGIYLLGQDSYYLHDRWHRVPGTTFSGMSLYLLAASLFCLSAFSIAVARAGLAGTLPMLNPQSLEIHPNYKGQLLTLYWYFVVPANELQFHPAEGSF